MSANKTCGDCRFVAIKRHEEHHQPQRDYCTNENVVGDIDRNFPACSEFEERSVPSIAWRRPRQKSAA